MRFAVLGVALWGCAPAIWNQREIDCSDAETIGIYGERLQLFGGQWFDGDGDGADDDQGTPDPGCRLYAEGLAGSKVRAGDEIRIGNVDDVTLRVGDGADFFPPLEFDWSSDAEIQLDWIGEASTNTVYGDPAVNFRVSADGGGLGGATLARESLTFRCDRCDVQSAGPYRFLDVRMDESDRDILLRLTGPVDEVSVQGFDGPGHPIGAGEVVVLTLEAAFESVYVALGADGVLVLEVPPGAEVDFLTEGYTFASFQLSGIGDTDGAASTVEVWPGPGASVFVVGSAGTDGVTSEAG